MSLLEFDIPKVKYHDIILNKFINNNLKLFKSVLFVKQLQMRTALLFQDYIGEQPGWRNIDLTKRDGKSDIDLSGCDLVNEERKIIIELKTSWNTDNSSAQKKNFEKLAKFKQRHPEYRTIYGMINTRSGEGGSSKTKIIEVNGAYVPIEIFEGNDLLHLLLGDDYASKIEEISSLVCSQAEKMYSLL